MRWPAFLLSLLLLAGCQTEKSPATLEEFVRSETRSDLSFLTGFTLEDYLFEAPKEGSKPSRYAILRDTQGRTVAQVKTEIEVGLQARGTLRWSTKNNLASLREGRIRTGFGVIKGSTKPEKVSEINLRDAAGSDTVVKVFVSVGEKVD